MLRAAPTSTLFPYTTLFRSARTIFDDRHAEVFRDRLAAGIEHVPVRPAADDGGEHAQSAGEFGADVVVEDRKSTRLNSSHRCISYAVFCLKKKTNKATSCYS